MASVLVLTDLDDFPTIGSVVTSREDSGRYTAQYARLSNRAIGWLIYAGRRQSGRVVARRPPFVGQPPVWNKGLASTRSGFLVG